MKNLGKTSKERGKNSKQEGKHSKPEKKGIDKTIYFFGGVALLAGGFLLSGLNTKDAQEANPELGVMLAPSGGHEVCLDMLSGEKLDYSFKTLQAVDFNLHYHENKEVFYPVPEKSTVSEKEVFSAESEQSYCLTWVNSSQREVYLSYQSQIHKLTAAENGGMVSVNFRIDEQQKSIRIVDDFKKELTQIQVGESIHNFSINHAGNLLGVLTSSKKKPIQFYDLTTLKRLTSLPLSPIPRLLSFSLDDQFLILADEHSKSITLLDTQTFKTVGTLPIPADPISLDTSSEDNILLIRTEQEILKVQINPLELLGRNVKIPVLFGEETMMINPNEWCFVHGVPHPLYAPTLDAMSKDGLSGYLPQNTLLKKEKTWWASLF